MLAHSTNGHIKTSITLDACHFEMFDFSIIVSTITSHKLSFKLSTVIKRVDNSRQMNH